jgi:DNA-directed RNA polymerase subunit RPC12/RpoP
MNIYEYVCTECNAGLYEDELYVDIEGTNICPYCGGEVELMI